LFNKNLDFARKQKCRTVKNLNASRNTNWFEGRIRKCTGSNLFQTWIGGEWDRRKWIAVIETAWTKKFNCARNVNWFNRGRCKCTAFKSL
jgi:hypothetical protein